MVKHITVRRVVCLVLALTSIAVLDRVGRMCFPKEKVFAVDESWTELMKAARAGRGDEVRRLAEKGPDLNARGGRMGLTPLIVAAANGHVDVVTILLDRGARPDEPDSSDMTALMNAVMFDQPAVVQVLLERGADVNARTGHGGMTPLMFVNNSEIASMLLLKGAEAQAKTTDGQTALDRAEARGQTDLAEVLRIAARQPAGPPVAGHTTTADAGARQPRAPVANAAPRTLSPEPPVDRLESGNELSENMSENMPENRQPARLTGGAVPRIVLQNPVAGFSLAVPEDWDMATGNAGNTEIAIDASTGASLLVQPAMWFFYAPRPPQQQAEQLARDLQTLGADAPQVGRTARVDEWEIRADFPITQVGTVTTRWLCRQERGMSYVIAAAVRSELAQRYQEDIDVAFQSCQLIEHPILQVFHEPRENAYRVMLPPNWNWEGKIIRTLSVPGYFQWKARRQDNLVGCFTSEPGVLNIGTPYFPAREAATGIVLDGLRQQMPDAQLEQIHELPRVGDHIRTASRLVIAGADPRGDKVRADYLATEHGVQVRVRVEIVTWMPSMSNTPGLEGRGNWFLFTSGTWAPAAEFDAEYALARGVQASLQTSMEWKKRQFETAGACTAERNSALDKANAGWDALIRDMERVPDPAGGPIQEVPNRDGQVWKDLDGVMWRVPPVQGLEDWVKNQGWAFIQ